MSSSPINDSALLSMSNQLSRRDITIENAKRALGSVIGKVVNKSADRKRRSASVTTVEHSMHRLEG